MTKYRIAIVENEESVAEEFISITERYEAEKGALFQHRVFSNGYDFLESDLDAFDVVFMDIDMPGINGMDTAIMMREKDCEMMLVFVTNLSQYAIEGYKVNALDFILKPITYADFYMVMTKISRNLSSNDNSFFFINVTGVQMKFYNREIEYIDMDGHDVVIHKTDGSGVKFRGSLKSIEKSMDGRTFYRCNGGQLINLSKVKYFDSQNIVLDSGARIPISRSYKKDVLSKLNEYYSHNIIDSRGLD